MTNNKKGFENQHEKILRLLREFNQEMGCGENGYIGINQHPNGSGELRHSEEGLLYEFSNSEALITYLTSKPLTRLFLTRWNA